MKISKILLSGIIAAGLSAAAQGQTVVHVVGSTAFRAPVIKAVLDLFNGSLGSNTPTTYTGDTAVYWGNSNIYKCNGIAISGTYNGTWYVFDAYFTGSASGVTDLTAQDQLSAFLNWNGTVATGGTDADVIATTGSGTYVSANYANYFDPSTPTADVAFSDSYYGSVAKLFADANLSASVGAYSTGPAIQAAINGSGHPIDAGTGSTASAHTVGIIPFEWLVNNPGLTGGVQNVSPASNITQQIVKELVSNGYAPLSQFSGNSADAGTDVYLVGRNEDSGTRIDTLAEGQAGFDVSPVQAQVSFVTNNKNTGAYPANSSAPYYYVGGNGTVVNAITQFPAGTALNTEGNISWSSAGHSGYITGGDVGNVLLATSSNFSLITVDSSYGTSGTGAALVGYISVADAAGSLSGNSAGQAQALSYDGVAYSVGAVEAGTYTVWDYEHEYYLSGIASGRKTFADALANQVFAHDADVDINGTDGNADAAGILYGSVNPTALRSKTGEGAIITP